MPEPTYENYPVDDRPTDFKPFPEEIKVPDTDTLPKKNSEDDESSDAKAMEDEPEEKAQNTDYQGVPGNQRNDGGNDYQDEAEEEPGSMDEDDDPDLDEDDIFEDEA